MVNVKNMQLKIDKLLSVFTTLIEALENSIAELKGGIDNNKHTISRLEKENVAYSDKISEYEALMNSVKGIVKPTEKV